MCQQPSLSEKCTEEEKVNKKKKAQDVQRQNKLVHCDIMKYEGNLGKRRLQLTIIFFIN